MFKNTATGNNSSALGCTMEEYFAHGGNNNMLIDGQYNSGGHANTFINNTQVGTASVTAPGSIPRSHVNILAVQSQIYPSHDKSTKIDAIGGNTLYASTGYINGIICEVVLFPTALSDTDRTTIVTGLKTKWGIA